MTVDPGERSPLPVACTLGPDDGTQRLADWRRIAARAGRSRSRTPGTVTLTFRDLPSVGPELERLVAAERACCGFLGWHLGHDRGGWIVEITGSDEQLTALPFAE